MCLYDFDSGVNYCAGDDVNNEMMPTCSAENDHLTEKRQSVLTSNIYSIGNWAN